MNSNIISMDVGGLDEMVSVWLKIVISGVNLVTFGQIERYTFTPSWLTRSKFQDFHENMNLWREKTA